MTPLVFVLLGGAGYALYEKHHNPSWTPLSALFATPRQLREALEHVRITSVPTPAPTAALDPGMSSDQVQAVNTVLTLETTPRKIHEEAAAAAKLGFGNTAKALTAKAEAVGQAKAAGATDIDVKKEQIAAAAAPSPTLSMVVVDPMSICEAQTLLNLLARRKGSTNVDGIAMPLPVNNVMTDDLIHCITIFQNESKLPATGNLDAATAAELRAEVVAGTQKASTVAAWGPDNRHERRGFERRVGERHPQFDRRFGERRPQFDQRFDNRHPLFGRHFPFDHQGGDVYQGGDYQGGDVPLPPVPLPVGDDDVIADYPAPELPLPVDDFPHHHHHHHDDAFVDPGLPPPPPPPFDPHPHGRVDRFERRHPWEEHRRHFEREQRRFAAGAPRSGGGSGGGGHGGGGHGAPMHSGGLGGHRGFGRRFGGGDWGWDPYAVVDVEPMALAMPMPIPIPMMADDDVVEEDFVTSGPRWAGRGWGGGWGRGFGRPFAAEVIDVDAAPIAPVVEPVVDDGAIAIPAPVTEVVQPEWIGGWRRGWRR